MPPKPGPPAVPIPPASPLPPFHPPALSGEAAAPLAPAAPACCVLRVAGPPGKATEDAVAGMVVGFPAGKAVQGAPGADCPGVSNKPDKSLRSFFGFSATAPNAAARSWLTSLGPGSQDIKSSCWGASMPPPVLLVSGLTEAVPAAAAAYDSAAVLAALGGDASIPSRSSGSSFVVISGWVSCTSMPCNRSITGFKTGFFSSLTSFALHRTSNTSTTACSFSSRAPWKISRIRFMASISTSIISWSTSSPPTSACSDSFLHLAATVCTNDATSPPSHTAATGPCHGTPLLVPSSASCLAWTLAAGSSPTVVPDSAFGTSSP
mmetsp:Transcript_73940/g.197058  ORF Transcript_73940/g.197058 Transcript_73940/m.197058 type:complete len:321 (-) Transcript_73940:498-1460(-)